MRYDEHNYICVNGSSDSEDSSHLAGILSIVEHPKAVNCKDYIFYDLEKKPYPHYARCKNSKYDFSRDQATPLMVGLLKQGWPEYVQTCFITGKDIIYPSLKGIETIAKRGKPYFWQKWWAIAEVYIHAKLQPLEEPFQTIAACEAYDLYKFWTKHNKLWKWSIRRYWGALDCEWRNEKELGEFIISYIEKKIK